MLAEDFLYNRAMGAVEYLFGLEYLNENRDEICLSYGIVQDNKFLLFVGIKTSDDYPNREATPDGWVVYARIYLDAETGEYVSSEYTLE